MADVGAVGKVVCPICDKGFDDVVVMTKHFEEFCMLAEERRHNPKRKRASRGAGTRNDPVDLDDESSTKASPPTSPAASRRKGGKATAAAAAAAAAATTPGGATASEGEDDGGASEEAPKKKKPRKTNKKPDATATATTTTTTTTTTTATATATATATTTTTTAAAASPADDEVVHVGEGATKAPRGAGKKKPPAEPQSLEYDPMDDVQVPEKPEEKKRKKQAQQTQPAPAKLSRGNSTTTPKRRVPDNEGKDEKKGKDATQRSVTTSATTPPATRRPVEHMETYCQSLTVKITKRGKDDRLGLSLDLPEDDELYSIPPIGLAIERVSEDDLAGKDGRLQAGDYIQSVNGTIVHGLRLQDIRKLFVNAEIEIVVHRYPPGDSQLMDMSQSTLPPDTDHETTDVSAPARAQGPDTSARRVHEEQEQEDLDQDAGSDFGAGGGGDSSPLLFNGANNETLSMEFAPPEDSRADATTVNEAAHASGSGERNDGGDGQAAGHNSGRDSATTDIDPAEHATLRLMSSSMVPESQLDAADDYLDAESCELDARTMSRVASTADNARIEHERIRREAEERASNQNSDDELPPVNLGSFDNPTQCLDDGDEGLESYVPPTTGMVSGSGDLSKPPSFTKAASASSAASSSNRAFRATSPASTSTAAPAPAPIAAPAPVAAPAPAAGPALADFPAARNGNASPQGGATSASASTTTTAPASPATSPAKPKRARLTDAEKVQRLAKTLRTVLAYLDTERDWDKMSIDELIDMDAASLVA